MKKICTQKATEILPYLYLQHSPADLRPALSFHTGSQMDWRGCHQLEIPSVECSHCYAAMQPGPRAAGGTALSVGQPYWTPAIKR